MGDGLRKHCCTKAKRRPLFVMALGICVRLVVPFIAKLAGNNDPMKNTVSHIFGQDTICVAMDFKGWMEAAAAGFILGGLMDVFACYHVYLHWCQEHGGEGVLRRAGVGAFLTFEAILFNQFTFVTAFNPSMQTDSTTVFWHTLPYLGLMVGQELCILFLLTCLTPQGVSRRWKIAWRTVAIFSLACYIGFMSLIVRTLVELRSEGITRPFDQQYDSPFERIPGIIVLEYAYVSGMLITLSMHSLGLHGIKGSIECDPNPVTAVSKAAAEEC